MYGLYANDTTARPQGQVFTGSSSELVDGRLPVNTWSHLATTYNGSTLALYVNGTVVASSVVTGNILTSTGALHGRNGAETARRESEGHLDDVRIYNRALTPADFLLSMNEPGQPIDRANGGLVHRRRPLQTWAPTRSRSWRSTGDDQRHDLRASGNIRTRLSPPRLPMTRSQQAAMLQPNAPLSFGTTYTLRVRGGSATAVERLGNPLAADAYVDALSTGERGVLRHRLDDEQADGVHRRMPREEA